VTLIEIASLFEEQKLSVIEASGLGKDALHVYFGMALFLAVRLVWRWRGGWFVAWLAVLAMACGGEWLDLTVEHGRSTIQPDAAHWHDIWNTMFWPTVLLLVGRWLQPRAKEAAVTVDEMSGENAERRFEQA
jgi:cell shape-determining protein MreD